MLVAYARRPHARVSDNASFARPTRGADTLVVGVFEGEAIAHDVEDGALQRLRRRRRGAHAPSATSPSPTPPGAAGCSSGSARASAFDAETRARSRPRVALGARAGARRAGGSAGSCPTTSTTPSTRRARRGHAARRLPVRPLQAAAATDDARGRGADRLRATTTSSGPVEAAAVIADARQPRARPAEHARQRPDARRPSPTRARGARGRRGRGARPRRPRRRRAWARSPPSRRAATRSRADRHALRRPGRDAARCSASSARRSRSTPAASRSSPRRRCTR